MKQLYVFLSICFISQINAQFNFGQFNTPYSGAHGLSYNPAEIVDSRYKFHMILVGANNEAANNYIGYSGKLISQSDKLNDSTKNQYLKEHINGKAKSLYVQTNTPIFTGMFAFGKNAIGLQIGTKFLATATNIDERLAMYAYNNKDTTRWGPTTSKDLGINGTLWGYVGLTYGRVIVDNPKHFLKFALTGKLNMGAGNTYATSQNLFVNFSNANTIKKANGVLNQQFSTYFEDTSGKTVTPKVEFKNTGFGLDLGFIYEKRDDGDYTYQFDCKDDNVRKDLNKYKFRFGVSLTDFGFVGFKPLIKLKAVIIDSSKFINPIKTNTFTKIFEYDKYEDSLANNYNNGIYLDTSGGNYSVWTPTNLNLFFDYHIWKPFYVAVNGSLGFVLNNKTGSKTNNSQFGIIPRMDFKYVGVYLPFNYNLMAEDVSLGLGLRLFFLNIGVQDVLVPLRIKEFGKYNGVSVSINVPILQRKHPKDIDHDLMSNKIDKCKKVAGDCNNGGCPDPDDDGDGVSNQQDKCINKPGLPEFDGCPDTDKDGVPDNIDQCPRDAGVKSLGGCPDTDGDGIADKDDACPKEAGPIDKNGCPDTDGDGIPNNLDECPFEKGSYENKGCPKDSIKDTDKDGLSDNDDKCPTEFGPKSNNGCPISSEAINLITEARESLEFETGSAVIRKVSYPSLEMLAQYLTRYPNYKVEISGYTDDVGDENKNLKLSDARANSVKNYFISKGVNPDRLTAKGYGESNPIGDNETVAGRAVNRRVEIDLK